MCRSAVSMIMVLAMIFGGMVVLGHTMFQSQIFHTIRVGVVIPEDASELQMISQFISSMDSVKSICSFDYMSQDEALEELGVGEIQAVLSLPESLYEDVYTGQPAQVTVYFPENSSLNIEVFREILNDGVKMLQSAETGVFAARDVAEVYKTDMSKYQVAKYVAMVYMEEAFERGDLFCESVLMPFGTMNLYQYYVAAGLTILLLMLGVSFAHLYPEQNQIIEQKLRVKGLGAAKISLIKVVVMSLILWGFVSLCYIGLCVVSEYVGIFDLWFDIMAFAGLWIMAMAFAVYFHLIYSVFGKGYQGAVFLLIINIFMFICSGAIIPAAYMPDPIYFIGQWMPLNCFNQYCAELLFGVVSGEMIFRAVIWIISIFAIGVFVSWNNISYGIGFCLKRG